MAGKVLSYLPNGLSERLLQKFLAKKDFKADENAMYLYKTIVQMIWPYDDQCRLVGEDVWEPEPDRAELTKLDTADVLTTQEAAKLLDPFIKPLPAFDKATMGKSAIALASA